MVNVNSAAVLDALSSPCKRQLTRVGVPTLAGPTSSQPKYFSCNGSSAVNAFFEDNQSTKSNKLTIALCVTAGDARVKTRPAITPKANSASVNAPRRYHL